MNRKRSPSELATVLSHRVWALEHVTRPDIDNKPLTVRTGRNYESSKFREPSRRHPRIALSIRLFPASNTIRRFSPMQKMVLLGWLLAGVCLAQQPKFDMADVHVSPTAHTFAQNFGGVLRAGKYVNRDATMLDAHPGGIWRESRQHCRRSRLGGLRPVRRSRQSSRRHHDGEANQMLRSLLEERFHLVLRNETRRYPAVCAHGRQRRVEIEGGSRIRTGRLPADRTAGSRRTRATRHRCRILSRIATDCTASAIAENLRQMAGGYLDHDVVDQPSWRANSTSSWNGRPAAYWRRRAPRASPCSTRWTGSWGSRRSCRTFPCPRWLW